MKTLRQWNKKAILMMACTTLATIMLFTAGVWPAFANGIFVPATGRTVTENEAIWGNPYAIQKFNDGTEKRFYKFTNPMLFGFCAFVYKDGKAIDDGALAVSTPEPPRIQPDYKVVMTNYEFVLSKGCLLTR